MKGSHKVSVKSNTILDEYMHLAASSVVDEVCIYVERRSKEHLQVENSKDFKSEFIGEIPIRVSQGMVPEINLINELKEPSGRYGWCIICRKKADFLCETTNVPICSPGCHAMHMQMLERLEVYLNYEDEKGKFIEDVMQIFHSVCKLSQKDTRSDMNPVTLKSKILSLELILAMIKDPPSAVQTHPAFISEIKDYLSESILKNSVSNDKQILGLSFNIFYALFNNFRHVLKHEIGVFIEEICLSILESGNSSYQHKLLVLQTFNKIAQNPKYALEIFVNYDCEIGANDIFERIIDCLAKIAKGKYTKTEHAIIIQPEEERSLKLMALGTITAIVKNCYTLMADSEPGLSSISEDQKKITEREVSKYSDEIEGEETKTITIEDKFGKVLKNKNIMNKAVMKFNIKPKNGVNYLIQVGYIGKEPEDLMIKNTVHFIKNTPGLHKAKIGEYFGENIDFPKKVMHAYIDSLDFAKMPFVAAMKFLMVGFRLPGESQKIDRILLKFGQKYYQDNPNLFVSANAPYELSYAVMILQTTIHNPKVKQKMSFEGFLTMSKDMRRNYNLTDDFMKGVYDEIKQNPITLVDDEVAKLKQESALANGIKKKQDLFIRETQHMVKKGKELISKRKKEVKTYEEVKNAEPLRAMFEVIWSGMLAVFSSVFEEYKEEQLWRLALEGFIYSIRITTNLNMSVELDAFVSVLDKFTSLSNLKEVQHKNIECIKVLIDIAMKDGNSLRNAWVFILELLSRLDYLNSVLMAAKKENLVRVKKFDSADIEIIAQIMSEIDQSQLDAIFSLSETLDNDGIVDFICNLCKVSRDELMSKENPLTFSLQKLVEVADLNMTRIVYVWKDIWKDVSQHLVTAGDHPNKAIQIFALDSLKQLAHKFLAKEEMTSYEYQKEFLMPFKKILEENLKNYAIIDFLTNCIVDICRKCGKSIKSGWAIVFDVLGLIGKSINNEKIISSSFSILNEILRMNYEYIAEHFEHALSSLLQYCGNSMTSISFQAFESVRWAVNEASDPSSKLVLALESRVKTTDNITILEASKVSYNDLEFWNFLFRGLQSLLMDERREIREKALEMLWELLGTRTYTEGFWSHIYEFILGYIPRYSLHLLDDDKQNADRIETMVFNAIDVFCEKLNLLKKHFNDFLDKINVFILEIENPVGVKIHKHFISKITSKLQKELSWDNFINKLQHVLADTLPKRLLQPDAILTEDTKEEDGGKLVKIGFDTNELITKSMKHLNLLNYIRTTIVSNLIQSMPLKTALSLADSFLDSAKFANDFNKNLQLRTKLKSAGFHSQGNQLTSLLPQEKEALLGYLSLSFDIYIQNANTTEGEEIVTKIWK